MNLSFDGLALSDEYVNLNADDTSVTCNDGSDAQQLGLGLCGREVVSVPIFCDRREKALILPYRLGCY